jgi:hypothetical protein
LLKKIPHPIFTGEENPVALRNIIKNNGLKDDERLSCHFISCFLQEQGKRALCMLSPADENASHVLSVVPPPHVLLTYGWYFGKAWRVLPAHPAFCHCSPDMEVAVLVLFTINANRHLAASFQQLQGFSLYIGHSGGGSLMQALKNPPGCFIVFSDLPGQDAPVREQE